MAIRPVLPKCILAEIVTTALLLSACGGGGAGGTATASGADEGGGAVIMTDGDATAGGGSETGAEAQPPTTDDVPEASMVTAAESTLLERETAQAATCPAPAYAKPKVAGWDMTRDYSSTRESLLARFNLTVIGQNPDTERLNAFMSGVKSRNPSTRFAQYVSVADIKASISAADESYPLTQELSARGWWLRNANNALTSWNGGSTNIVNLTGWTTANAAGQRWPQFKARYDYDRYFKSSPNVDFAFVANTLARPRVDADWRRIGIDQSRADAAVQSAMRAGYAAYWNSLRALKPGMKVMAGTDNDLSSPEYKGALEGAHLDGLMGQTWSLEAWAGWTTMMTYYRGVTANVRSGGTVVFSVYGASPIDYAAMRFGLASSLMQDGHFMYRPKTGSQVPAWYDEYSAPLGSAIDSPRTAAASNGIWMRRFENGLVLVNPQGKSATISIGTGYRRLAGSQAPAINSGAAAPSTISLGAREGLILVQEPALCTTPGPLPAPTPAPAAGGFATPKVVALDYSRDVSAARQAFLARYDMVVLSMSRGDSASTIAAFTSGIKTINPKVKIGNYVITNEVRCEAAPNEAQYDLVTEVNRAGWWLRDANGVRSQWTTAYGACDINLTQWAPKNAAGQTWPQWKWLRDYDTLLKSVPAFDFVFIDAFMKQPRKDADFRRIGSNQSKEDETIKSSYRAGQKAYIDYARSRNPKYQFIVNSDGNLSHKEYKGLPEGAFLEGAMGKSWSTETWAGWAAAMDYYRGALLNTRAPHSVIFQAFAEPNNYSFVRYGLASAMLEDGWFMHIPLTGMMVPHWYDEFGAKIGEPVEAPPTAPAQNGIYKRRYSNGLVLVNPSKTVSAAINVGAGYRRLTGTQEPSVNNGQSQSTVTLPPRSGLLMLKG